MGACNYVPHPDNSRPFLTDEAAAILRAIMFEFNVSQKSFPTMLCYWSLFFLRRVPSLDEFPSRALLPSRFQRLEYVCVYIAWRCVRVWARFVSFVVESLCV